MSRGHTVASFDIGSNTVLMLVAEQQPDGSWARVEDHAAITRVAEGLDRGGVLYREPLERTSAQVAELIERAREIGVDTILATGTAPFRRAANGREAAEELSLVLGVPLRVVTGDEEAQLSLAATFHAFPGLDEMTVVDIGGASTEVIRVRPGHPPELTSVDVGSVRLTERYIRTDPIPSIERQAVVDAVRSAISASPAAALLDGSGRPLVGIAGTVTTLAALALEMDRWDDTRVHGYRLRTSEISRLCDLLFAATLGQRKRLAGLPEKRADVIPAGAELLRVIAEAAGVGEVLVSDRGLRWGRLYVDLD